MAHSFDVFDAAGTHACSCQSNGGLASNFSKMHCEIGIGATKSCIFIILIYFSINGKRKNRGFSSTDVNFTIHFIIVLARPPLLWQKHAWVPAASKTSKE
jgi:hypothetical protein